MQKIPKKFVRKYGETLSSPVILKLPSGLEWKVGLTKSDGRLWLHKGWPEFAAHHSINRGHLLVFRYEGSSQFYVLILDTSTTEIDYPIVNPTHLREPKKEEVEILDDPIPKTGDKSLLKCPRPLKRMRRSVCKMSNPPSRRLKSLSPSETARALERVSGFNSENPFFTIVMQLSYAHGRSRVVSFKLKAYNFFLLFVADNMFVFMHEQLEMLYINVFNSVLLRTIVF